MRKVSAILIALTMMFCTVPLSAKDSACIAEVATLKTEIAKLKLESALKDLTLIEEQKKPFNALAVRLVEEYYRAAGKTREGYDLNLQTLEFSKRPAQPEAKPPTVEK